MKIKVLEFLKDGYMQESFAFGGSSDSIEIDPLKTYPSSLQNYLIDTGSEVILVDTGLPVETPDFEGKPDQKIYMGKKINNFEDALKVLGYKIEDISKVLVTHKHMDHIGELRLFKNAKIFISQVEADSMNLDGENVIKVSFKDGKYKNFDGSEKISDGVYMVPAYGHTTGNSLVIVEGNDIFYMIHGDITYTDKALMKNALSVVFEDKEKAIDTLNRVREFITTNDTVYLSTHTPEGVSNLRDHKIMKL